jgi:hypothetical protein
MQSKTVIFGQRINGAVTLWVRRDTVFNLDGSIADDTVDDVGLVLTAEGVAPYMEGDAAGAFARANQAVRVMETFVVRAQGGTDPCETYRAQKGNGVAGNNMAFCASLTLDCSGGGGGGEEDLLKGMLGDTTRDAGGQLGVGSGAAGTFGSLQDPASPGNCVQ